MKAYKLEVLVVDHDEVGEEEIKRLIEHTKYPNYCIAPMVQTSEERDIGEWSDDHPLNFTSTAKAEYVRLFAPVPAPPAGHSEAALVLDIGKLAGMLYRLSLANRRDGWAGQTPYYGRPELERAKKAVDDAEREVVEYVKLIAATPSPQGAENNNEGVK